MSTHQSKPYMPSPEEFLQQATEHPDPGFEDLAPQPSRWRWVKRFFLGLLILILIAAVAAGIFAYHTVQGVSNKPLDMSAVTADASGRTNVLLLGVGDPGHAGEKLSDSIMVISFDSSSKQVVTTSIPRDLRVAIPGHGTAKINQANALGGASLAADTVSQTLGIPIQYTITTNFSGVAKLVDAVGGVDVDVKEALVDNEYPCADNQYKSCGINIQPGVQHMDGAKVLEYTRCRKGTCGNDFGRAARQQEVINLLMKKLVVPSTLFNPLKLAAVSSALRDGLQTDIGGLTMARLAWAWHKHTGEVIRWVLSTSPGGMLINGGGSDLSPVGGSFDAIQQQAANLFTNPPKAPDTNGQ